MADIPRLRAMLLLCLPLLWAVVPTAPAAAASDEPTLFVAGRSAGDFARSAADLRVPLRMMSAVSQVPASARSLLILADGYPRPRLLTARERKLLESLLGAGARVFIEFARPEAGDCFGVSCGTQIERPLYERLVVLQPLGALRLEDLLEEHDTACVPFGALPTQTEVLVEYDRCLGTYDRVAWPEEGLYSVTVDLGEARPLAEVTQRYGAGEPNYRPESVELQVSTDGQRYQSAGKDEAAAARETVRFHLPSTPVRFVRLQARKLKRSPVTDFLFLGEIEARDVTGANPAQGRPYVLAPAEAQSGPYRDDGRKLTDGVSEGFWSDRLSVGFATTAPRAGHRRPALVRVRRGPGEVLLSSLPLSDYSRRRCRLTTRWQELCRQVVLQVLPPEQRRAVEARYVPLEVHTEPRVWVEPGAAVTLQVRTAPGARVSATLDGAALRLTDRGNGHWEGRCTAAAGTRRFSVSSLTATGRADKQVVLDCRRRREKYRAALDRNMAWFTRSGVLPQADGSGGVYSQVCLAWLDSKPVGYDFLASPFRVDCNAMTAEALYLYGLVSEEQSYRDRACRIMDTVVAHQYTDPARPSLGAFPWLYDNCDTIFFWDDNSRIGVALLWLYHWTGKESYLRAALLSGELFRQVAREDGCVHRHAIGRGDLDKLGREAYRQFSQGLDSDYRLTHWFDLAAVTGDPEYARLGRQVAATYGGGLEGLAHARHYAPEVQTPQTLPQLAEGYLNSPVVRRYGVPLAGGGEYALAFEGDCGIATRTDPPEPLADQIYVTPWQFRAALRAWKAGGGESCRRMCEQLGDYLVRIQYSDDDPRLDGCWMRGFDLEHWEYYGAPYDPAYGPYSAYTGWMNAIAAQAFAWYLLDEPPFIPQRSDSRAAALLQAVRSLNPKLLSEGENLALGRPYELSDPGAGPYADDGRKLTDGVIDGGYGDHRSVGWGLPAVGQTVTRTMTLDLGRVCPIALITQQYGAGQGGYNPDTVRVSASVDSKEYRLVAEQRFGREGGGLLWLQPEGALQARYLRFELQKQRRDAVTDFLFVGETKVYAP